jgi:hypothetical protein
MDMAGLPDAGWLRAAAAFTYGWSARAGSVSNSTMEVPQMNTSNQDFRKALDGVISARNREATRQIVRANEFQLIGAITKRPN